MVFAKVRFYRKSNALCFTNKATHGLYSILKTYNTLSKSKLTWFPNESFPVGKREDIEKHEKEEKCNHLCIYTHMKTCEYRQDFVREYRQNFPEIFSPSTVTFDHFIQMPGHFKYRYNKYVFKIS